MLTTDPPVTLADGYRVRNGDDGVSESLSEVAGAGDAATELELELEAEAEAEAEALVVVGDDSTFDDDTERCS